MKKSTLPTQTKLADKFIRLMRKNLSATKLKLIDQRNAKTNNDDICHSHDFIDANQVMADAWDSLTTTEMNVSKKTHLNLLNKAWSKAKKKGFATKR